MKELVAAELCDVIVQKLAPAWQSTIENVGKVDRLNGKPVEGKSVHHTKGVMESIENAGISQAGHGAPLISLTVRGLTRNAVLPVAKRIDDEERPNGVWLWLLLADDMMVCTASWFL